MQIKKVLPFSLLSFILAVFVWFLAQQGTESVEISFFVPLVFQNLPSSMQITSEVPTVVNVAGRVTRRHSNDFNPTGLQAVVDLTNVNSGTFQYVLTEQNILTPETVSIVRIIPAQIDLLIEDMVEKTLTIHPRFQRQLKQGKIFQGIQISPETVRVQGPESVLKEIDSIFTNEIDLESINRSADMVISLDLPHPSLRFLDEDVENYIAHILVSSLPIRKRFDDVPIRFVKQSYVSVTNPTEFNIYIEGPEELLNDLDASLLYGNIDLSDYEPGSHWVQPQAILPEGITLLQQWPKISLWVKPQKLSTTDAPSQSSEAVQREESEDSQETQAASEEAHEESSTDDQGVSQE